MRTPDGEEQGTQAQGADTDSGALADGFGGATEGGGGGEADDAFGSGWPGEAGGGGTGGEDASGDGAGGDGGELFATGHSGGGESDEAPEGDFGAEDSFAGAEEDMASFDSGSELSAFEFEPDYVPDTDTDWDVSGDGVVDGHDLHEAATGLHDFGVDPADSHGHAQNEGFFHTE